MFGEKISTDSFLSFLQKQESSFAKSSGLPRLHERRANWVFQQPA
jgi:hypothetical protein